jgi:hypothetical protein
MGGLFLGAASAALAPAGPFALLPLKMAIASADSVGSDVYVAVVVDFGSGSSMSSVSKCVPVPANDHDSDALAAAVGESNVAYSSSGLLCAIDNYPANGVQNCGQSVGSGNYDYWSYWHGATGTWVYANNGPAEQSVSSPNDDVQGWRYQTDEPDNPNDPPPSVPPSYAQICNASTEVPPPQQQSSPTTTPTPTPAPGSATTVPSSTAPGAAGPTASTPPGVQPRSGPAGKAPTPGASGSASTTSTTGTKDSAPATPNGAKPSTSNSHKAVVASPASDRGGQGSGDNVLLVVLVAALVAALGGAAVFRWRRRPADE